ncbi:unnamed protein product [Hymenolepis diminuta]|uniref:Uncharacterized protein n=1 Tax=Hymenolepis diminuta TaxID=6216 RepID=A0A0R3SP75_HYMDI|nr:unnamed protein product [Hymenolepis diminuta]
MTTSIHSVGIWELEFNMADEEAKVGQTGDLQCSFFLISVDITLRALDPCRNSFLEWNCHRSGEQCQVLTGMLSGKC